jgi:hypothetical protein
MVSKNLESMIEVFDLKSKILNTGFKSWKSWISNRVFDILNQRFKISNKKIY